MTQDQIRRMTVSALKQAIENEDSPAETVLQYLESDDRAGVRQLAVQIRNRQKAQEKEKARLERMCALENKLRARGFTHIAGVDEAGRGPLAGPVIAAAVIFPSEVLVEGINDSKKLSEQKRDALYEQIHALALCIGVGEATPREIDTHNIRNATHLAMKRALQALTPRPDKVLVDGNAVPESGLNEMAIVGGDRKSMSIAAASIIAKVTRDRMMTEYHAKFPAYGFAKHKGYGSADHLAALQKHGPTPIHRMSFGGVPNLPNKVSEDFEVFAEGIAAAKNLSQLKAIGHTIALASPDLPDLEVQDLRKTYRSRQIHLNRTGNRGEAIAISFLKKRGFEILDQNYRAAGYEIDIIAQNATTLAFVEVKTGTQSQFGPPQTWVTPQKQTHIIKAAQSYLAHKTHTDKRPRFDVIGVDLNTNPPSVSYFESAFSESR